MTVRQVMALMLVACLGVAGTAAAAPSGTTPARRPAHAKTRPAKHPAQAAAPAPAVATAPAAVPADTNAHPSFAGRWKLSMTRSSFGIIPGGKPTSRTDLIEQDGTRIKQTLFLVLGSKPDTTIYIYSTGGTPTVNKVAHSDIRSVVTWEGRTLHLVSTAKLLMLDTSLDDRWVIAPNGRELVYQRHVKFGFGEGDQTLIFERE